MFICLFSDLEAMEVKSSTSISALDAIFEAPETEDVDMMSQVDILKKYLFFEKGNGMLLSKLFWPTEREKNVLVIEKNFWNSRWKAKNLQSFRDH